MTSDDAEYYRGRAAVEHALAQAATNIYARRAHQELAENYEILWRLLCAKPTGRTQKQRKIGEGVGFTTLIQTLAAPQSADLVYTPGRSSNHAVRRPVANIAVLGRL